MPPINPRMPAGPTGPNFNGKLFDANNGADGYYQDTNKVWWLIKRHQDPVNPLSFEWETAIILNPDVYIASDGKAIRPGWSSGTSSSAQNAIDHIDAFAIRYRLQHPPSTPFPWLLLLVGYFLLKGKKR